MYLKSIMIVATASDSDAGTSLPKMSSSVTVSVTLEYVFCIFLTPRAGPKKWRSDLTNSVFDYCGSYTNENAGNGDQLDY